MPYVKRQPRYNDEGKIFRYDYYLAENKRIGSTVQTKIIRPLTEAEVRAYQEKEHVPSNEGDMKEPKEQWKPGAQALMQLFTELAETPTVGKALVKWANANPEQVELIKQLEAMI